MGFHAWETSGNVHFSRVTMLIIAWSATAFFLVIPIGFCVAYASVFSDRDASKWIQDSLVNLCIAHGCQSCDRACFDFAWMALRPVLHEMSLWEEKIIARRGR